MTVSPLASTTIRAKWYYPSRKRPVRAIVVHTAETPEDTGRARAVARYFAGLPSSRKASAHACVDDDEIVACVDEEGTAFAAPGLNTDGLQVELIGRAGQGTAGWADDYSVAVLERAAQLVADWCRRHDIPVVKLEPDDLTDPQRRGICGHVDVTKAFRKSTHTDPGPAFPWDPFLDRVRALVAPATATDQTPILGPALITVRQAVSTFVAKRGTATNGYTPGDLRTIFEAYRHTCEVGGLSLGVALAQVAHETGWLTSWWSAAPRRNPAGIGVNGNTWSNPPVGPAAYDEKAKSWRSGNSFPRWAPDAVDAHVGRLLAYALPVGAENHQQARLIAIAGRARPIPELVRGCATVLRDLGRADNPRRIGWASPGAGYGAALAKRLATMQEAHP